MLNEIQHDEEGQEEWEKMKTAHLTWEEVKQRAGDAQIDVIVSQGSKIHGRTVVLEEFMAGSELMALTKDTYMVTAWPEDRR